MFTDVEMKIKKKNSILFSEIVPVYKSYVK